MPAKNPVVIGLAAAVTMILAGCGAVSAPDEPPPATVESIAGSPVQQIQLTEQAMRRLGITTQQIRVAKVAVAGRPGSHLVIPYSAVVYDTDGSTWAYVNTAA
jgi:uncharacterized protein YceK